MEKTLEFINGIKKNGPREKNVRKFHDMKTKRGKDGWKNGNHKENLTSNERRK